MPTKLSHCGIMLAELRYESCHQSARNDLLAFVGVTLLQSRLSKSSNRDEQGTPNDRRSITTLTLLMDKVLHELVDG